jgi:hypothetical protein
MIFRKQKTFYWYSKNNRSSKIAGGIIENIINENPTTTLDKVAIVLGEENLLVPLLYSLPSSVGALNITMGYQVKQSCPNFDCQIIQDAY